MGKKKTKKIQPQSDISVKDISVSTKYSSCNNASYDSQGQASSYSYDRGAQAYISRRRRSAKNAYNITCPLYMIGYRLMNYAKPYNGAPFGFRHMQMINFLLYQSYGLIGPMQGVNPIILDKKVDTIIDELNHFYAGFRVCNPVIMVMENLNARYGLDFIIKGNKLESVPRHIREEKRERKYHILCERLHMLIKQGALLSNKEEKGQIWSPDLDKRTLLINIHMVWQAFLEYKVGANKEGIGLFAQSYFINKDKLRYYDDINQAPQYMKTLHDTFQLTVIELMELMEKARIVNKLMDCSSVDEQKNLFADCLIAELKGRRPIGHKEVYALSSGQRVHAYGMILSDFFRDALIISFIPIAHLKLARQLHRECNVMRR